MSTTEEDSEQNPFDIITDDGIDDDDKYGWSWTHSGYWKLNGNDKFKIYYISDDLYMIGNMYWIDLMDNEVERI